ncbi:MAG: hypothetical protein HY332_17605 [Chloroflexi bacterium]|nr:hypothetical protein [Chloroflexota bacterium]
MRNVPLVLAAFTTIAEADRATGALLESGFPAEAIAAVSQFGGGRVVLGRHVTVQAAGKPARLLDRSELAGGAALAGGFVGFALGAALAWLLPGYGVDPLAPLAEVLPVSRLLVALAVALALAGLAALMRRSAGLPRGLAVSYALRLEQGDVVLGVQTATGREARAAEETLAIHGAHVTHITRGTLEPAATDERRTQNEE